MKENPKCPHCYSSNTRYLYKLREVEFHLCLGCLRKFQVIPDEEFVALERPRQA